MKSRREPDRTWRCTASRDFCRSRMQTRRTPVRSILSIVGVILLLAACASDRPDAPEVRLLKADAPRTESPDVGSAQVAKLVRGNNDFAFDLYSTEGGEDDLIFSPTASHWLSRWHTP